MLVENSIYYTKLWLSLFRDFSKINLHGPKVELKFSQTPRHLWEYTLMSDLTWSTLPQFGTHTKSALTNLLRKSESLHWECVLRILFEPGSRCLAQLVWYPHPCRQKEAIKTLFLISDDEWTDILPQCSTCEKTSSQPQERESSSCSIYNQLYTQVHASFPTFPMLSLCGTKYQTLCIYDCETLLSFKHCICTLY